MKNFLPIGIGITLVFGLVVAEATQNSPPAESYTKKLIFTSASKTRISFPGCHYYIPGSKGVTFYIHGGGCL